MEITQYMGWESAHTPVGMNLGGMRALPIWGNLHHDNGDDPKCKM
jgi:hypothetical protein